MSYVSQLTISVFYRKENKMIRDAIHGFCMALADSVPGVSGGTIAFILGFYDQFIGSIHDLAFGKKDEKIAALRYLLKLGIGWIIGMVLAILILSRLFETHIYTVSSVFIGFIIGAIPLVVMEEKESTKEWAKGIVFLLLGIALVAGITYFNGNSQSASLDLGTFSWTTAIRLFFIGMVAICAMFLPGISGSTILLIFGAYIPVISAVKELLHLQLQYFPLVFVFGLGVLAGAASVVKLIQYSLEHFRTQTIYFILGMMAGSLYAIIMGPVTLSTPQPPLSFSNFNILACVIGLALVLGLQALKNVWANKTDKMD